MAKREPELSFNETVSIQKIDAVPHRERISHTNEKVTFRALAAALPDGCFVPIDGKPYLPKGRQALLWTAPGYQDVMAVPAGKLKVLTPRSGCKYF